MSGAEGYATLAVNTVLVLAADGVRFCIIRMSIVCALVNAYLTTYTTLLISLNEVFRKYICFH
jgi:hypothetical protein